MADIDILELEDFALELAHTAGGIAQAHFRRPVTVENKSATAFDPVTNADRAIERVLRTSIDARYFRDFVAASAAEKIPDRGAAIYTTLGRPRKRYVLRPTGARALRDAYAGIQALADGGTLTRPRELAKGSGR